MKSRPGHSLSSIRHSPYVFDAPDRLNQGREIKANTLRNPLRKAKVCLVLSHGMYRMLIVGGGELQFDRGFNDVTDIAQVIIYRNVYTVDAHSWFMTA